MDNKKKFPETLQQAITYFSDADNALEFVAALRWPDGEECPHCASKNVGFLSTRRIWKCRNRECRKQFSVKVGTIFEDSPLGLEKWLPAAWLLINCKNGISSYELGRDLGITQKSCWFMLHRIRLAMQTGTFEKMSGEIEADETFIGGLARNMHAKKRYNNEARFGVVAPKTVVAGILERKREDTTNSMVRTYIVPDTTQDTLHRAVRKNVKPGSNLYTDEHHGYKNLSGDYWHSTVNHAERYVAGRIHTNGIENFWSLVKRTLKGTYVSVEPFHLFRYLDEQAFRFNNRTLNDGERFLIAMAHIAGRRLTYRQLTGKETSTQTVQP